MATKKKVRKKKKTKKKVSKRKKSLTEKELLAKCEEIANDLLQHSDSTYCCQCCCPGDLWADQMSNELLEIIGKKSCDTCFNIVTRPTRKCEVCKEFDAR